MALSPIASRHASSPGPSPQRVFAPIPKRRRPARQTHETPAPTTRSLFGMKSLHRHQEEEDEESIDVSLSRALRQSVNLNGDKSSQAGMEGSLGDKSQLLTAEELERTAEQLLEHCDAVNKTNKPLATITNLPRSFARASASAPDEDRLSDDYAARGGGKKRKVPSSAQQGPTIAVHGEFSIYRDERQACVHSCGHTCGDIDESASFDSGSEVCCEFHYKHPIDDVEPGSFSASRAAARRIPVRKTTPARKACGFEKKLYKARKSQVLDLHADALACIDKQGTSSSKAPTIDELEELVQALEFANVTGWEGDRVGTGVGMWEGQGKGWSTIKDPVAFAAAEAPEPQADRLRWRRRGRALDRARLQAREPIKRGGWVPEGSFEFEASSPLAKAISSRHHQLATLRSKVTQLLTLTIGTPAMSKMLNTKPKAAPAAEKKAAKKAVAIEAPPPAKASPDVVIEPSADDPHYVPPAPAKGKKKKKKSANASNPHHVKNYVPTRKPTPQTTKEAPTLPDLINMLFFPPPTRFLNARPGGKPARENEVTNSDEYVCCFCEHDLFFGSDALMNKAVRRRKKVLERRSKASAKARNVVDGKGLNGKAKASTETAEVDEDGVACAGGDQCRCDEIRAARKSKGGGDDHHPGVPLPKEDSFSLDDQASCTRLA